MCDSASDPVNRSLLDRAHDCPFFNPDVELAQCLQNPHPWSFHETDPGPVLDQSDSRTIVMPLSDGTHAQNTTARWRSRATGPTPLLDDPAPNESTTSQSYWNEMYPRVTEPHLAFMVETLSQAKPLGIEALPDQLEISPPASLISPGGPDTIISQSEPLSEVLRLVEKHPPGRHRCDWFQQICAADVVFTNADKERYLERVSLSPPIIFVTKEPVIEWGISLEDIRDGMTQHLVDKDVLVLQDCGPSISIRICWPGYPPFKRQISSRNWRKKKGPITKEKLAKSLATTTAQFIEKMSNQPMEDGADSNWKVGPQHVKAEGLILVSLHHVSKGSWQPQFRLRHDHIGDT